jgi:membrane protein
LPARDIGHIGLAEILEVARSERSGHLAPRLASVPAVEKLSAQLDDARRQLCGDRTVRDLVDEAGVPPA